MMTDGRTPSDAPRLQEIGVLALVPNLWRQLWMPRHHVLSRLASYFSVAWIEPPIPWRNILSGPQEFVLPPSQCPAPPAGLVVSSAPRWLPKFHSPRWLADFSDVQRIRRARRQLASRGCRKIVLYIWRPQFDFALQAIDFDTSCYHIDDEYSFSREDLPVPPREQALIETVDQVIVHSPALLEKKGSTNPNTRFIPNGVDFAAYAQPVEEPQDLRSIPRPRVGYSGKLKRQLDWPLLTRLVASHKNCQFVFVGPVVDHAEARSAVKALEREPNVHFLGAKSVVELARYPQHFDVCLMPYRTDDYTKYIYPMKLHEYLASGRPVVGSRIASLEEFAEVVHLAESPEEWVAALHLALAAAAPERINARRAVAARHDWNRLAFEIAVTMAERLGVHYTRALREEVDRPSETGE